MNLKNTRLAILFALVIVFLLLSGCTQKQSSTGGEEKPAAGAEKTAETKGTETAYDELVATAQGTGVDPTDLSSDSLSNMYTGLLELSDVASGKTATNLDDKELADEELDESLLK